MKIVREYGVNGDKKLRYNMVEAAGMNLSEMVGQRFGVKAYLIVEAEDLATNEIRKSLKIVSEDGEIIGTNSQSFITSFERFLDCMESDECTEMEVVQMKSKAGRNYLRFKA